MLLLLPELGNQNSESKSLTTFTSQDRVGNQNQNQNQNQNCGAHHNLRMRNERLIPKGEMRISLQFPGMTILSCLKIKNNHIVLIYN